MSMIMMMKMIVSYFRFYLKMKSAFGGELKSCDVDDLR